MPSTYQSISDEVTPILKKDDGKGQDAEESSPSSSAPSSSKSRITKKMFLAVMVAGCGMLALLKMSTRSKVEVFKSSLSSSHDLDTGSAIKGRDLECYPDGQFCWDDCGHHFYNNKCCSDCCRPASEEIGNYERKQCGGCIGSAYIPRGEDGYLNGVEYCGHQGSAIKDNWFACDKCCSGWYRNINYNSIFGSSTAYHCIPDPNKDWCVPTYNYSQLRAGDNTKCGSSLAFSDFFDCDKCCSGYYKNYSGMTYTDWYCIPAPN